MAEHAVTATNPADGVPQAADEHQHGIHQPDHHNSPEQIKKEMRVYMAVFGGLMVLTATTVWACFGLKLPIQQAVVVALTIASLKGFLVAGFFMHLLSEKKVIYGILVLTVVFFAILLWGPVHDVLDKF
jgi:cytochrome c oxidase subunit 4